MRSKTFKKLTAMLLAVMLVFSMCVTGVSVSAAETDGTEVLYLLPNSNWLQSGARFALYTFGDAGDAWTDMTDADADGVYEVTVPAGDWNGYIFCRMSPTALENNWNNKWNQSSDLTIPEGMNCYSVASGTWDKGGGNWSYFTPGTTIETQPETEPTTLEVIPGEADSYYLFGYINGVDYACEGNAASAGIYKFVDGTLTVNFEQDSYVGVKKGDNSVWYMTDGWQGEVTEAVLYDSTITGTTSDKLMIPGGVDLVLSIVENADGTITLSYVEAGVTPTEPTEPDTTPTEPTEPDTTPTEPAATDYYLFGYINGANYGCEEDYANLGEYKFVNGTLTATFAEASYVAVKTSDNVNWYMTDGWAGTVTSVTLYNSANLGTDADKLMVPAGEVTFTLVDNGDDTFTLSYEADTVPTIPVEPDTTPTVDTEPVEEGYYLFGYINGANYGCEEDYTNIGEYKFVNGTLTATFTETSYVAVKTSDNVNWYMTDDWQGEVTEVTLYNSATLGTTANKLMVPGGVEVTFTLVDNGDDTFTLSYVADEVPTEPDTTPTEPDTTPTEPEPTNPVIPAEGVSIYGDINLTLTDSGEGIYEGKIDLQAGAYEFRISELGTPMCFGYTFTDTIPNIRYYSAYTSATTFNATGGRYTFIYNTTSDSLKVTFKPFEQLVELFGDINVELVKSTGTLFTGSARVEAGTYTFKINDQGVVKGFGYTFDDVVYGAQYNAAWSGLTTFVASGGIYSVKYDTATSALTFMHAPAGLGDVRIFGDLNVDLAKQGETLYSAQTVLEAGSYQFRVDALGTTLCNGSTFTDTMNNIPYMADWKAASTFTATEKLKFTFIFDTSTNTLKVFNAPIDTTKVLVAFENSNLELTSEDGVTYTATTTLEAGTYSFRIDEFGTTMCYGGTFTDTISNIPYSSAYKSATTFNATGGDYTFSYNVDTDKLTVKIAA